MRLSPLLAITCALALPACKESEPKTAPAQKAAPQKAAVPTPPPAKEHHGGQHDDDQERDQQPMEQPLEIIIAGKTVDPWTSETLAKVKPQQSEGGKDTWSLRELVHQLIGPKARVKAVVGGGQRRAEIDEADWNDPAKTPALRLNRQGQVKLQWQGTPSTKPDFVSELRGVRKLEIVE